MRIFPDPVGLPPRAWLSKAKSVMNDNILVPDCDGSNSPVSFTTLIVIFWVFQNWWGYCLEWEFQRKEREGEKYEWEKQHLHTFTHLPIHLCIPGQSRKSHCYISNMYPTWVKQSNCFLSGWREACVKGSVLIQFSIFFNFNISSMQEFFCSLYFFNQLTMW